MANALLGSSFGYEWTAVDALRLYCIYLLSTVADIFVEELVYPIHSTVSWVCTYVPR